MKFEKAIKIENKIFSLVDVQRGGSAIYKDDFSFLRIGLHEKIDKDLALHRQMEEGGFPVARLLSEGKHKDLSYFIEESLGSNSFGEIFKKETQNGGHVTDSSFKDFLDIVVRFGKAQLKNLVLNKEWKNFSSGIHLDILCSELPEIKDKINNKYNQVEKKLGDFPFGILHGDLTPFNIYPKGIIDLEDSFLGPVAYDVGALYSLQNWFPKISEDEFHRVYQTTADQKKEYLQLIDKIYEECGLPKISDYLEDLDFAKGIWFAVRMQHMPNLQRFRYGLIKKYINE